MEYTTTNNELKEQVWQNIKDLPEENIKEILNFIIYTKNNIYKYEQSATEELNPEFKQFLDSRILEYKKNPENSTTWSNVKKQFNEKYNYDI